jgi:hypothetical protein
LSPRAADFRKKQIAAYNGWLRSKSHKRGGGPQNPGLLKPIKTTLHDKIYEAISEQVETP